MTKRRAPLKEGPDSSPTLPAVRAPGHAAPEHAPLEEGPTEEMDLRPSWERPAFAAVEPATEEDGSIFASLYREKVVGEPPPLPPAQPARPDLRKLTCLVCGAPASPHRVPHAVRVMIPARTVKAPA